MKSTPKLKFWTQHQLNPQTQAQCLSAIIP